MLPIKSGKSQKISKKPEKRRLCVNNSVLDGKFFLINRRFTPLDKANQQKQCISRGDRRERRKNSK